MGDPQPTVKELRAARAAEDDFWKEAINDLADEGEFYTVDVYRLLLTRGMEPWERPQRFFPRVRKVLDELEDNGELQSYLAPSPICSLGRRYFHRPGDG